MSSPTLAPRFVLFSAVPVRASGGPEVTVEPPESKYVSDSRLVKARDEILTVHVRHPPARVPAEICQAEKRQK